MAGQIRVDTEQVGQIANNIADINTKLHTLLENSQKAIQGLANTWEGAAANATITAVNEFAGKYFENYYNVIDNYVKFLRTNVATGYFNTETVNTKLADTFK